VGIRLLQTATGRLANTEDLISEVLTLQPPVIMSASLDPRRQSDLYWKEMEELKAASICIRLCRNQLGFRVKVIDLIKAVASSGGIAGWVVWRDAPFLWSGLIAGAQLLDALKGAFPFARDYKAAGDLTVALELIFIDAQYEWERVYTSKIGNDAIMAARRKIQKLRLEAERRHFPEGFEPPARFLLMAAKDAGTDLTTLYSEANSDV